MFDVVGRFNGDYSVIKMDDSSMLNVKRSRTSDDTIEGDVFKILDDMFLEILRRHMN